jgi:hypothetical protein
MKPKEGKTLARPRLTTVLALLACLCVGAVGVASASSSDPVDSKSPEDIEKKLIGTWRLSSTTIRDEEGKVTGSFYKDPVGKLTYTRRGDVWAFTGERDRTAPSALQLWYTGRFQVDARTRRVVHHVRFASPAGVEHMDLSRHYRLHDDRLILSAALSTESTLYLRWVRAP